ncbi:GNAT family N-acetyltransferase [Rhizobium sp. RCAM05350]|nr:GNAT family N-acetyltransferase [Rhizobium sp. RCAM05350]
MMSRSCIIRGADKADMPICAAILNDWIDETSWMPRVHDHEDVERYYSDIVFQERQVKIADIDGRVCAFMALSNDAYVTALYANRAHRRAGLGKSLIDHAKTLFPDQLNLWTFDENKEAQRFYNREKFIEVRRTNGDNEENLPDILFQWAPTEGATS